MILIIFKKCIWILVKKLGRNVAKTEYKHVASRYIIENTMFVPACLPALPLLLSKIFLFTRENQGEGAGERGRKREPAGKGRVFEYTEFTHERGVLIG